MEDKQKSYTIYKVTTQPVFEGTDDECWDWMSERMPVAPYGCKVYESWADERRNRYYKLGPDIYICNREEVDDVGIDVR